MGENFLVVDIESGSVATALAHVPTPTIGVSETIVPIPQLFAEKRVALPFIDTGRADTLAYSVDRALEEALSYTAVVASSARNDAQVAHRGELDGTSVFLSAPWANLSHTEQQLRWDFEPFLVEVVRNRLKKHHVSRVVTTHPFARAAARAAYEFGVLNALVGTVGQEVTEFVLADGGNVIGRATVPLGARSFVRTLQTHGGLAPAEAHSALKLAHEYGEQHHPYVEPLRAAAKHYATEFAEAARALTRNIATTLLIIAEHPFDDFVARALARHAHPAFPEGSSVRALPSRHLEPLIASHSKTRDVPLMLGALYTTIAARQARAA